MRQFAAQKTTPHEPVAPDFNHLLMLAIEQALAPPLIHRRNVYQPMRVVVVNPALRTQGGPPKVLPRALPAAANVETSHSGPTHSRAVRGEILSDESGRLYEKLGRQIRPIHQLASGRFGEVIDLRPGPTIDASAEPEVVAEPAEEVETGKAELTVTKPQTIETSTVSHRKLFADPGQWRVVWWGEFKEILAGQLAHPERLRDTYRIPCYVQVLETERTVAIPELAEVYKSAGKGKDRLYLLTDEIAAKLDLVLPLRPLPPQNMRREPNSLLAHERVFRLIAANDPTIDVKISLTKPQAPTTTVALKEEVPTQFVTEWEFKLSRDEVLYDMSTKPGLSELCRRFCRKLRVVKRAREFRKWQTLLAGRKLDEQLWSVRPPIGTLADSHLREWVVKTLELGGYNSKKMVTEWEVFWRRKGL